MVLENVFFYLISPGEEVFRAAVNAIINYLSNSQTTEGATLASFMPWERDWWGCLKTHCVFCLCVFQLHDKSSQF